MTTASRIAVPLPAAAPAGIYVHIPFCRYICPYCDFNVYAGQQDLIPAYIDALEAELQLISAAHPPTGPSPSLFIGGGTPSLLTPQLVEQIINAAGRYIGLASNAEITMESNPDNLDLDYCRALRSVGVNRLSIGVQSLQGPGLKVLGRLHGKEGAARAFEAARAAGFDNISLDFIYGWPGQSREQWDDDLTTIIATRPDHVSLYALIVEPGTPYETAVRRGTLRPVDDDTVASYYDLAVDRLGREGWEQYEISNWVRSGGRRSVHNQIYWQNGQYYGLGAGAHSFLDNARRSNIRLPVAYIDAVGCDRIPIANEEHIEPAVAMGETMMLGLRLLRDGVSEHDFELRHESALLDHYATTIARFEALELIERVNDRVRLTSRGALVSNNVLAEFLP